MDYLQSLSLRDLLIFSPESYFKLFELSNQALWPFQIPLLLCCLIIVIFVSYKCLKGKHQVLTSRIIFLWLAGVWGFVAYWYFDKHFSQISTYAHQVAYFFYAQAFLFAGFALFTQCTIKPLKKVRAIVGGSLIIYGLLIHPIVSLSIWNQETTRVELFSVAPDPTVIATLGFTLLLPIRGYLLLLPIPLLWLVFSFMTYQAF